MTTERSTPARAVAAGARGRAILAIHPGALGDVLQAVPALAALRAVDGGSRVTLAAQPRIARLLAGSGAVDAALPFDGLGLESLFADGAIPDALRARLAAFSRVVSWFGSRAHPFPARLRALAPGAVVAPPVPEGAVAVWRHLLATVAPWNARAPDSPPVLRMPAAWPAEAEWALDRLGIPRGRPIIVLHPGAGGAAKRWRAEKMAAVVRQVPPHVGVVVHQGPADAEAAAALLSALATAPEPVSPPLLPPVLPVLPRVLVEPPLETLAAVLARAIAYLGSDSGVSHLAAAVGSPSVILFAPGARARWTPWSPRACAIDVTADGEDVAEATAALISIVAGTSGTARDANPVAVA